MDFLNAPWRSAYITAPDDGKKKTVFSDILSDPDDEANLILHRGRTAFAVLNKFPYSTAHTMVLPYKTTGDFCELTPAELEEVMSTAQRVVAAIREEFRPDAFNIGFNLGAAAGAGIPDHIHLHIVPRWSGDHNFMTVIGQTRVTPTELGTVWKRLKPRLS